MMRSSPLFGIAALLLLAPPVGPAVAGNVLLCESPTRAGVIACCEKVSDGRLPIWMQTSHTTCRSQAFCAPRRGKSVCRIAPAQDVIELEPDIYDR